VCGATGSRGKEQRPCGRATIPGSSSCAVPFSSARSAPSSSGRSESHMYSSHDSERSHLMKPSPDLFDVLEARGAPRCTLWSDVDTGLRAVLVIDDLTLGPAAGGIRTRAYPSLELA